MVDDYASVYGPKTFNGVFDGLAFILNAWPEAENYLTAQYTPNAGRNQSKVNDQALLDQINKTVAILDTEKRKAAVKDMQQVLADKMYYVPTEGFGVSVSDAPKYLQNWTKMFTARSGVFTTGIAQYWLDK